MPRHPFRCQRFLIIVVASAIIGCCVWLSSGFLHSNPVAHGWIAYSSGNWERAAELARTCLKSNANDASALRLLARASVRLGRDTSAVAIYDRFGLESLSADDLCLLGIALNRSGDARGLQVWERARAAEANHPETLLELTRAYSKQDRLADAAETGRRLASCPGWQNQAEALLGAVELARNDPDSALVLWRRVLERGESGRGDKAIIPRKEIIRALLATHQPTEARLQLEGIVASEPAPESFWLLSRAYLQEGLNGKALAAWEKSAAFRHDNPFALEPSPFAAQIIALDAIQASFRFSEVHGTRAHFLGRPNSRT